MNNLGHEVVARTANGELAVGAGHRLHSGNLPKALRGGRVVRSENDGSLRAVSGDKPFRLIDVDNPSVLHDGYPVTQPLRLLHQMSRQKDSLASFADAADQIPDRPSRFWIQPSGQF